MKPPLRLRWHQFYVILAMFDLLVIVGSIWLHHQALDGFRQLLDQFAEFDNSERWLGSVREKLVEAVTPVNDSARSGLSDASSAQFKKAFAALLAQRTSPVIKTDQLLKFWSEVELLHKSGMRTIDVLAATRTSQVDTQALSESAASLIGTMNHHKSRALRQLDRVSGKLLAEAADAQLTYQRLAERHEMGEKLLAVALLVNIACILWYRRTLQRTDEVLISQEQRLHMERRERLASIGEICSGVAHGIQNPLASIHSSAELILDLGRTDPATRQRAQDILCECGRLSSRVQRLLAFARAQPSTRNPLIVQVVIRDALAELAPRFEQAGVFAELSAGDAPLLVLADTHELESILIELLSNAIDHAPRDSRVTVSCTRRGDHAVIDVTDTGPGIPPNQREDVFKLFYTTRPGGTGVGLSSAKRMAESLEGSLDLLNSERGSGTTFRLRIPLVRT